MRRISWLIPAATAIIVAGCKEGGIPKAKMESGKKVYTRYCESCHMENGNGVPGMNAPLAGSAYVAGDPEKLIRVVVQGSAALANDPDRDYKNAMAPMGHLNDNEIADVLTYVRNSFGNTGPAVVPDSVRLVREKVK